MLGLEFLLTRSGLHNSCRKRFCSCFGRVVTKNVTTRDVGSRWMSPTLSASPSFPFFYDKSFLQPLMATLMSCHPSKGKRKAISLAPPAMAPLSSDESDTPLNKHHPTKKSQPNSPAHVKQAAMDKVSKLGSSSKGMAGFAALISSAGLSTTHNEMNQGLHSGSSSKWSGSQSKAGKVV